MGQFRANAPGKLILTGEHSVVYGYPAISAAVNRRLYLQAQWDQFEVSAVRKLAKNLRATGLEGAIETLSDAGIKIILDSQIPIGSGIGSSAALSAVLSALLLSLQEVPAELDAINQLAYELECHSHGRPSGADNTVVVYGGLLSFQRSASGTLEFKQLPTSVNLPTFWAINTGRPKETTAEMVALVRSLIDSDRSKQSILDAIGQTTIKFGQWLTQPYDGRDLVEIIRQNHAYLNELGVVSNSTKVLVDQIEEIGGAAKISGAGGQTKASGVLIAYHPDSPRLERYLKSSNLDFFPVIITTEGLTQGD